MSSEGRRTRRRLARALVREEEEEKQEVEAGAETIPEPPIPFDRGSHGCLYSPPLPCADPALRRDYGDTDAVSKYGKLDELLREKAVYDILDKIDPDYTFHLKVYQVCRADPVSTCPTDVPWYRTDVPGVMIMERAQHTLSKELLLDLDYSRRDIDAQMTHLMRALRRMAEEGIVYNDIHAKNIVVGADGTWRFIDFATSDMMTPREAMGMVYKQFERMREMADEEGIYDRFDDYSEDESDSEDE